MRQSQLQELIRRCGLSVDVAEYDGGQDRVSPILLSNPQVGGACCTYELNTAKYSKEVFICNIPPIQADACQSELLIANDRQHAR